MPSPEEAPPPRNAGLREIVATRIVELERERVEAESRSRALSWVRLASFAVGAAGVGLAASGSPHALLWLAALAAAVFAWAFMLHSRVLVRLGDLGAEAVLLEERRGRLASRRRSHQPPPQVLLPPHAVGENGPPLEEGVVDDLDLVTGPRSLFGFLDASSTALGASRLLEMIRRPLLDPAVIRERQEAVRSAAEASGSAPGTGVPPSRGARSEGVTAPGTGVPPSRGARSEGVTAPGTGVPPSRGARSEGVTAPGSGFRLIDGLLAALLPLRQRPLEEVPAALAATPSFVGRRALLLWSHVAGSAAPALLAATAVDARAAPLLFLAVVFNLVTIGMTAKRSNPARDRLVLLGPFIEGVERMGAVLRRERPSGAPWRRAGTAFDALEGPGGKLVRRIHLLELHGTGILFEIFNALVLWELRLLPGTEALVQRHRQLLEMAAGSMGEAEALVCLAIPLAEGTEFTLPAPLDAGPPRLEAVGLGHPLIEPESLVVNDLSLDEGTPIAIVTGSNMAGKSTLLKSVGVSLVLACMGGPVRARSLRWTPLEIHTDINVRDSLDDGKSYFAVEVERVEMIVRRAREGGRLIALFDEPFRGTNSAERQAIAMALIAHLRAAGGLYLVATHDLAITRLASELPGVVNLHFREEVDGHGMRFDYRLRPGPAPTRNAIRVLESRGYPAELVRSARERLAALEGRAIEADAAAKD